MEKTAEIETSFRRKHEAFQTQAAALVHLTKQYKELQARLDSAQKDLGRRFREDQIGVKEKEAESSKSNLVSLKSLIEKHVDAVLSERVREKREACEGAEIRVSEAKNELNLVEECEKEVELKRGAKEEMDSRAKEFHFVEEKMGEWCCRLELKEREIGGMFEKLELRGQEFEANVEEICVMEKKVEECLSILLHLKNLFKKQKNLWIHSTSRYKRAKSIQRDNLKSRLESFNQSKDYLILSNWKEKSHLVCIKSPYKNVKTSSMHSESQFRSRKSIWIHSPTDSRWKRGNLKRSWNLHLTSVHMVEPRSRRSLRT